jgi:ribosomal protein L24E
VEAVAKGVWTGRVFKLRRKGDDVATNDKEKTMNTKTCSHCGKPCREGYAEYRRGKHKAVGDVVVIARKWVSHGTGPMYTDENGKPCPVVLPCHESCRAAYMDDRAKCFAVLDETMNTHRDFVRVEGQAGYIMQNGEKVWCKGWMSSGELGVAYIPSDRYREYY